MDYVGAFELLESDAKANRVFKTANKNIAEVKPEFGTLLHLYIKHYAKSPLGKGETNTDGARKQQFFEEHMLKNMTLEMLEAKNSEGLTAKSLAPDPLRDRIKKAIERARDPESLKENQELARKLAENDKQPQLIIKTKVSKQKLDRISDANPHRDIPDEQQLKAGHRALKELMEACMKGGKNGNEFAKMVVDSLPEGVKDKNNELHNAANSAFNNYQKHKNVNIITRLFQKIADAVLGLFGKSKLDEVISEIDGKTTKAMHDTKDKDGKGFVEKLKVKAKVEDAKNEVRK